MTFPSRPYANHGGAAVPHYKNTAYTETQKFPLAETIILPMSQHIGAPCVPVVNVGDYVCVGTLIADSTAFVSSPIHSSVSGTVSKIDKIRVANGSTVNAVFIKPDGLQKKDESIAPPVITTREELVDAVRKSGIVGLGGAGFPVSVKLNIPLGKADTLIINAAECEPYITSDHREILENSWNIMSGLYTLIEMLHFKRVIIGVEENKPDAIKMLTEIAESETYDPRNKVKVLKLKTRYPQGAEKMLVYACTGRKIPTGKLPLDVGCVVMNITTVSSLAYFFKTGTPLVLKRITVDGSAVGKKCNCIVPIGTPIQHILDCCEAKNYKKVLYGGPMMGVAVFDTSLPVLKQSNAILAFGEKDALIPEETDCINCGRCVHSCPMKLQPVMIVRASDRGDMEALEKLGVNSCIECGCCTYNCPAKRFITQQMRVAKSLLRDSKQKG